MEVPPEIWCRVLGFRLEIPTLLSARSVCRQWKEILERNKILVRVGPKDRYQALLLASLYPQLQGQVFSVDSYSMARLLSPPSWTPTVSRLDLVFQEDEEDFPASHLGHLTLQWLLNGFERRKETCSRSLLFQMTDNFLIGYGNEILVVGVTGWCGYLSLVMDLVLCALILPVEKVYLTILTQGEPPVNPRKLRHLVQILENKREMYMTPTSSWRNLDVYDRIHKLPPRPHPVNEEFLFSEPTSHPRDQWFDIPTEKEGGALYERDLIGWARHPRE